LKKIDSEYATINTEIITLKACAVGETIPATKGKHTRTPKKDAPSKNVVKYFKKFANTNSSLYLCKDMMFFKLKKTTMRKGVILLGAMLLSSGMFVVSCNKQTVECYSCDKKLDSWVKENKEELANVSLREMTVFSFAEASAVFSSLKPQKRFDLWNNKFNEIVKNAEWTEEEIGHVKKFQVFLSDRIFERGLSENDFEFITKWQLVGINEFEWDDLDIAFFLSTLYTTKQEREELPKVIESQAIRKDRPSTMSKMVMVASSECTCNIRFSPCNAIHKCAPSGCQESTWGCGALWLQACNGECFH